MNVTCNTKGIQLDSRGNKLANASIALDGEFVIRNLSVMNGPNGLFVSMPSQRGVNKNGETAYYDTAFPLTGELRAQINSVVINAYQQKLQEMAQAAQNVASYNPSAAYNSSAGYNPNVGYDPSAGHNPSEDYAVFPYNPSQAQPPVEEANQDDEMECF